MQEMITGTPTPGRWSQPKLGIDGMSDFLFSKNRGVNAGVPVPLPKGGGIYQEWQLGEGLKRHWVGVERPPKLDLEQIHAMWGNKPSLPCARRHWRELRCLQKSTVPSTGCSCWTGDRTTKELCWTEV